MQWFWRKLKLCFLEKTQRLMGGRGTQRLREKGTGSEIKKQRPREGDRLIEIKKQRPREREEAEWRSGYKGIERGR